MVKLKLAAATKSLRPFELALPPFSLITGVNGSGKSQLLEAIQNGNISVDPPANRDRDIKLFDWNSWGQSAPSRATSDTIFSERDSFVEQLENVRRQCESRLRSHLSGFRGSIWELLRLPQQECVAALTAHAGGRLPATVRENMLTSCSQFYDLSVIPGFLNSHPKLRSRLSKAAEKYHSQILLLPAEDLDEECLDFGAQDPFQNDLARVFLTYFEAQKLNRLRRLDEEDKKPGRVRTLSEDEFEALHGPPPWNIINEGFLEDGLKFQVDWPQGWTTTGFTPKLLKIPDEIPVGFSELSSGEKILIALRLCAYTLRDDRHAATLPKMLLLDEVDALLHPSMSREAVKILMDFAKEHGTHILMTTHSATTVAVAPEEAVFLMGGKTTIEKVTRQRAVSALTAEIPSLALSFHGRRQVFVEDGNDAEVYTKLYELLARQFESERTLAFISTASRNPNGTEGGGCDRVLRIVADLNADSVLGLVDWDGRNKQTARVHILAEGERYAIENCLFDPLVVLAALAHQRSKDWGDLDLNQFAAHRDDQAWLQARVSQIEAKLGLSKPEKASVTYNGGMSLQISSELLRMKGHDLERLVEKTFPAFRSITKGKTQGFHDLKLHLVDPVLRDNIAFVPQALALTFQNLLNCDA